MGYIKWWLPLFLMALLTPWSPSLDLAVSQFFYRLGGDNFISNDITTFFYTYGVIPADLLVATALMIFITSYILHRKEWRAPALVLILTLAIGAGLIIHPLLKDQWGRPRPKQIVQFGGMQEFRPYYKPNFFNQPEPSRSFPCGHCSMGFYFFALMLVGKRIDRPLIQYIGLSIALGLGIALSIVRIAQGGHFLSDTLMTALIMWETALLCDFLIYHYKKAPSCQQN